MIKELSDYIKDKIMTSKEHYDIIIEPIMTFVMDTLLLIPSEELKYKTVYEFLCYFVFPLLPNYSYLLLKNDNPKPENKFGLYNPVITIKNGESSTKNQTMFNFLDKTSFCLHTHYNLGFDKLESLLESLNKIFEDENTKTSVNLRFAMFVIFKRILLLKENVRKLKFQFTLSDMREYFVMTNFEKGKTEAFSNVQLIIEHAEMTGETLPPDYYMIFSLLKLEEIIKKYKVVENTSQISLEMFNNKVDSESLEITNFFSYLAKSYTSIVNEVFVQNNFNLSNFYDTEKKVCLVRNLDSLISERLVVSKLSDISESFINSFFVSAGTNKDLYLYLPRNSMFHISTTVTYYDSLIHIYRYTVSRDLSLNGNSHTEKFINLQKEQKIESDFTPFEISVFSYKPEIYKVVFDNSFSWMNGKDFKFKSCILTISQHLSKLDLHRLNLRYKIDYFRDNILNKITEFVFFKYESFLGKNIEKYHKKTLNFNHLLSFSQFFVQSIINSSDPSKTKESLSKGLTALENIKSEEEDLEEQLAIASKARKANCYINSYTKGRKALKIDKIASIDYILKGYIKNVFVRVNFNDVELEEENFIKEIKKFEDDNEQFIFFTYYYLKQNKDYSLGDIFEKEMMSNSNMIFMRFPLVESLLIYYLYDLQVNNEKTPENVIYFHFDKSMEKYNYAFYTNGDLASDDQCFGEEVKVFENVIRKIIDTMNFGLTNKKNLKEKPKQNSDDESDDSGSEDEKEMRLKSWRIVTSITGPADFISSAKTEVKDKVKEINSYYFDLGKTKKPKKIKTIFKPIEFVESMTNLMHCFELH